VFTAVFTAVSVCCGTLHFRKIKLMEMLFKNVILTSVNRNRLPKININRLPPLDGMFVVCSESHTKHVSTINGGQNENFMNVKAGDKCRVL
jgi:hypothetical protein